MSKQPESKNTQQLPLHPQDHRALQEALSQEFSRALRRVSRQRIVYMALNAFALVFFAVILFNQARLYHDLSLWAIGVCLMIFALVEFLELDFQSSGKSLLDYLVPGDNKGKE